MEFYKDLEEKIKKFIPKMDKEAERMGEETEIDMHFGDFLITFIHHFDACTVKGGDEYMNIWERTTYVFEDRLEVLYATFLPTEDDMPEFVTYFNQILSKHRDYASRYFSSHTKREASLLRKYERV